MVRPKTSHSKEMSNASRDSQKPKRRKPTPQPSNNASARKASMNQAATIATIARRRRNKRPAESDRDDLPKKARKITHSEAPPLKRATASAPKPKPKATTPKLVLNNAPRRHLNIYVFGTNEEGEMGLGAQGTSKEYHRPQLNLLLASAGVVQLASGGMHCAALTHDDAILTWGVNDLGALGRDTYWDGGYVDMKTTEGVDGDGVTSDRDDSESTLNPREATPVAIDRSAFPLGTKFVQLTASDNATFALTDEGLIYGWGTFKSGDGKCRFSSSTEKAARPVLIPALNKITKLVSGSNHVVALTNKGAVLAWGYSEQYQTGRRLLDRRKSNGLIPQQLGLSKGIVDIGAGNEHSFAVHENGDVLAWGLNNFAQTGIYRRDGGDDFENIKHPTPVESLRGHGRIICIGGGNHHSVAVTDRGACFTWGRCDAFSLGIKLDSLPAENVICDARGKPRILTVATRVPHFDNAVFAAAGSDQCLGVAKDGKTFSWGYSINGETGQGTTDDVEEATVIDDSSVRGKNIVFVACGGHFSIMAEDVGPIANDTNDVAKETG